MCGISGIILNKTSDESVLRCDISRMANTLKRRGPDAEGYWIDSARGIALSHLRLGISDPTDRGAQPMTSKTGRYVIIFNGEIYNHMSLRKYIENINPNTAWRGLSDTETLLESISLIGLDATLKFVDGMFAFAVWDNDTAILSLCRDRVGEKPIYYYRFQNEFFFASEIAALRSTPRFKPHISPVSLYSLLAHQYIREPLTIFSDVHKLNAGELLTFDSVGNLRLRRWWSPRELTRSADNFKFIKTSNISEEVFRRSVTDLKKILLEVLQDQISEHSNPSLLLSGGVDSSLICCLLSRELKVTPNTFSVGFLEAEFDETKFAREISHGTGSKHFEHHLSGSDIVQLLDDVNQAYSEPFADSSQIACLAISKVVSQGTKVVITGDGGDEIFGGYQRYAKQNIFWKSIYTMPEGIREFLTVKLGPLLNLGSDFLEYSIANGIGFRHALRVQRLLASYKHADDLNVVYDHMYAVNPFASSLMHEKYRKHNNLNMSSRTRPVDNVNLSAAQWMMLHDFLNYLPGDILTKMDRAAMFHSVENRSPFLDRRVVEFSQNLPVEVHVSAGITKRLLKSLLCLYAPKEFVYRRKQGFAIPLDAWLRSSMRDWAQYLLSESSLKETEVFHIRNVRALLKYQQSGLAYASLLWPVLIFQNWALRKNG